MQIGNFDIILGVPFCILHLKHLPYHSGELLLCEGVMLYVRGEAMQFL